MTRLTRPQIAALTILRDNPQGLYPAEFAYLAWPETYPRGARLHSGHNRKAGTVLVGLVRLGAATRYDPDCDHRYVYTLHTEGLLTMIENHPYEDDGSGIGCRACPLIKTHPKHTVVAPSAATMNAVGSETGRVMSGAPETSVAAAVKTRAGSHRDLIYRALVDAEGHGVTSIEAAALLPLTAQGHPQVSNRSASRLGELWEEGRAAVQRERGTCLLGVCSPHDKPHVVHKPSAPCDRHGKAVTRGGASVWIATR